MKRIRVTGHSSGGLKPNRLAVLIGREMTWSDWSKRSWRDWRGRKRLWVLEAVVLLVASIGIQLYLFVLIVVTITSVHFNGTSGKKL